MTRAFRSDRDRLQTVGNSGLKGKKQMVVVEHPGFKEDHLPKEPKKHGAMKQGRDKPQGGAKVH